MEFKALFIKARFHGDGRGRGTIDELFVTVLLRLALLWILFPFFFALFFFFFPCQLRHSKTEYSSIFRNRVQLLLESSLSIAQGALRHSTPAAR